MSRADHYTWHVTLRMDPSGRTTAEFGHRKKNAGWIWDEAVVGDLDLPMTETAILEHLYWAVCEFFERRQPA